MNETALVHDSVYGDEWGDAEADVPDVSDHAKALAWFAAETDCLVAVCREAAKAGLHGIAWRLAALMRTPFLDRHPVDEWLPLGLLALRSAHLEGDRLGQAVAQIGLGVAYRQAQRVEEAIAAEGAALRAARAIKDRRQETAALTLLGHAQRRGRRLDQARRAYGEALGIAKRAALEQWAAWATVGLAGAHLDAGATGAARKLLTSSDLAFSERYPGLHAERLRLLAALERESGALAAADSLIRSALGVAQATGNAAYAGEFGVEYGRVLVAAGHCTDALVTLAHAVDLERRIGDRSGEASALDVAGEAHRKLARFEEAIAAHAEAATAHLTLDDPWRAAIAFANLGRARTEAGQHGAAASYREALRLIAPFEDARARELRGELTALLSVPEVEPEASAEHRGS